jgi:prefoldin subunit 5|tara:strand:+ start:348 stop:1613 length:1266 start_codon:yes stop_codon:yes gene_type:complete
MFNLGGIVSGIGIAADETVRAGRRNKHEKEQIALRDSLARDRERERFEMSRQEQLRKDRKLRRDRGMVLKQMGFNDEATAYLASNDYTFNMGKGLYDTVAERRKSGQYMDINDFYDVKYNKPVHSLDVQKGTKSAKPTINLQEFYKGDMDQNLDFFVEFVNQKGLADPQSFDDILAEKTELFKKAMLDKSNADSDANMPQGRKDEIKGTVEKLQNEITNLYHSKQKSDAFITALQPAAGVDSDLYFKTVEKVEADTARVFNMFKQSPAEAAEKFGKIVNLPQEKMQSVFANLAMGNNGLITGGTAEQRIKAYNILRKSTVESYIQTIAQLDGKKATVDALKKHFSEYRTTEPELVYTQSEAFIDGKPTFKYYEYLKQQLEKRGGNTFEIMIPTQGDFGFRTITKEEVDEYGAYFESLMAGP